MTTTTAGFDASTDLAAQLHELISGYQRTQLVVVAAQLGLADLLAGGPQSVTALADATGSNRDALHRLIRALAGCGVFAERGDGRIESTPLAELLQSGTPGSLHALALAQQDFYPVWGQLAYSIQTGEPSFNKVYGQPNWAYRKEHPDANQRFNALMAHYARARAASLVSSGFLPASGTVVDVGGGDGTLLAIALAHHPGLRGLLFDQAHVVAAAEVVLTAAGVADRCDVVSGDFFTDVPTGGDAYVLSGVLCDWEDAEATQILRRCRHAMGAHARLVLVEALLPAGNEPSPTKIVDIQLMLTNAGGRIRSGTQWHSLLDHAGFNPPTIVTTAGISDVLQASSAS